MKQLISAIKHQKEIKLIKESELFDERYYLTRYPEAAQSGLSAIEHYVRLGSAAGLRPNAFFDDTYYRDSNPDIKKSKTNPLVHFIKFGAKEGRNPSRNFDTRFYLEQHPDVAATGVNPLWHFITYGASEHRETDDARMQALSENSRQLYEQLAQLEPFLPPFGDLHYAPLDRGPSESLAGRAYFKLAGKVKTPFTHLLVLQRLIHGGAATLSMHFARLIKEKRGADSIVVLLTDSPDKSAAHLLPEGVTMVALDDLQPELTVEDKVQILSRFIIETQPQVVHNMDSDICWRAFERYNRQFHAHSSLVASLFMFTYNKAGRKAGYASQYLNNCIDKIDLVLTDNHGFRREIAQFYALEQRNQDKFAVIYTPILSQVREPDPGGARAKRVLWSSRLHPDKRPDLLSEIAKLMPDFTFEIYGDSALAEAEMEAIKKISNINLHGPYFSSQDLPYKDIGAYLHTSRHEGGAITLKEATAAGIPAVAPPLGLIPDIVTPDTGWLVTEQDDPAAYAKALRECLSNPEERARRIRNAQEMLKKEHSWESFVRTVTALPGYKI